ncbi:MAG TPA: NAD(P)-dependent oxidoreductase [Cellulomonas sp.]
MSDPQPVVVLTGAAGRIGTYLRSTDGGLAACGWDLRLVDAVAPADGAAWTRVDLATEEATDALVEVMAGADAVVHLAGVPTEDGWTHLRRANIDGTYRLLEAARRTGVRRVVLASSNHAVGYYPTDRVARTDGPGRPDSYYGVSKVAVEALGSLYADKYGVESVSLRIGMCADRPATTFDLATWLSPGDAVRLVDASLRGPVTRPVVAFGVSANTRRWWDLSEADELGYRPRDDAEAFADDVADYTGPVGVLGHQMTAADPHDPAERHGPGRRR